MTTAYVYDPIFLKHTAPNHPENAQRLKSAHNFLSTQGLLDEMAALPARPATGMELGMAHPQFYIERIEMASRQSVSHLNPDTYLTQNSYQAASTAVGGLIDLSLAVARGEVDNGMALIRPPGHHATADEAMGFCLFANVALAARAIQSQTQFQRIAIIDFDVHHGNGTQDILYEDSTVFFASSHQYPFFPGSGSKFETGQGPGQGTTLNIPLAPFTGDDAFEALYTEVVFPALHRFQPEFILVSAGYDAHWQDPLAYLGLSNMGYARLSQLLVAEAAALCEGRIVFALEGGYNLRVLSHGVANSVRCLLGRQDFTDPYGTPARRGPRVDGLIRDLKRIHRL